MQNNFNIILTGVGGQGLITLLRIIDEAALIDGYDVRSSELHGLSQRGGSVEAHVRFGKEVLSPMVQLGKADLIFGLEMIEGLRESLKAGKQTKFLVNEYVLPFENSPRTEEVKQGLQEIKNELHLVPASKICKEKLQNEVVSPIYLLGYAVHKKIIPLSEKSVIEAIKKIIPEKYQELNVGAFNLAKNNL